MLFLFFGRFPSGRAVRCIFFVFQTKKDAATIPNAALKSTFQPDTENRKNDQLFRHMNGALNDTPYDLKNDSFINQTHEDVSDFVNTI